MRHVVQLKQDIEAIRRVAKQAAMTAANRDPAVRALAEMVEQLAIATEKAIVHGLQGVSLATATDIRNHLS